MANTLLPSTVFAEKIDGTAYPKERNLSILFTHDIHSHLDKLSKAKTVIDQTRVKHPDTFLLDGGDFSMGTLYQTTFQQSATELKMLGTLGYDATTIGNHELDYGDEGLTNMLMSAKRSHESLPSIVLSNLDWQRTLKNHPSSPEILHLKKAFEAYGIKDYIMIEKNKVRIAVFGIFGKEASRYAQNNGLVFQDPIQRSKEIVAEIKKKERPDFIVCLSHSGTDGDHKKSEDERLAKAVPDINLIISAHTHTVLEEPLIVGNTLIASCGKNACNIGYMEFSLGKQKATLEKYKLIPLDSSIPSNPQVVSSLKQSKQEIQTDYLNLFGYQFDEVLAYNPYLFSKNGNNQEEEPQYPIGDLLCDAYIYALKKSEGDRYEPIDLAIIPSGTVRSSLRPGKVTVSEVYDIHSLGMGEDGTPGYPLICGYLSGKEIKLLAEIDASLTELIPNTHLFMSKLTYHYNKNRLPLNKVTEAKLESANGQFHEIKDDQLYRIVSNLYTLQLCDTLRKKSFGILSIHIKDENGLSITDPRNCILYDGDHEWKEWTALAAYLSSFPKINGLPTIPDYYAKNQPHVVCSSRRDILDLTKAPNSFSGLYALSILFSSVITSAIVLWGMRKKLF